jgi:hypothetical protein
VNSLRRHHYLGRNHERVIGRAGGIKPVLVDIRIIANFKSQPRQEVRKLVREDLRRQSARAPPSSRLRDFSNIHNDLQIITGAESISW